MLFDSFQTHLRFPHSPPFCFVLHEKSSKEQEVEMVRTPTGKTEKSGKSGSAQTTAHFFRNVPNGMERTI